MDVQEGLPKHQLLQEEPETEQEASTQPSQSTNIENISQIKQTQITSDGINTESNPLDNDAKQDQQIQLTIKKLSGENVLVPYTDELKQMTILGLKQRAFPDQFAQGFSIRFIYRGRLIGDQELLKNLEFLGHPIIHAQINPPLNPPAQQTQPQQQQQQQQQGDIENQQNQFQGVIPPNQYNNLHAIAAQLQQQQQAQQNAGQNAQQQNIQNLQDEGTTCDFWFGFFLVLILNYVGIFAVFCCQYPKKTKKGAILGIIVSIIVSSIFSKSDEQYSERQY